MNILFPNIRATFGFPNIRANGRRKLDLSGTISTSLFRPSSSGNLLECDRQLDAVFLYQCNHVKQSTELRVMGIYVASWKAPLGDTLGCRY